MYKQVLDFIKHFANFGYEVIDCFTCGNCYWFAKILADRFNGHIVYDAKANHFGCQIGCCIYDITGDVYDQYNWSDWEELQNTYDPLVIQRIYRDCINLLT